MAINAAGAEDRRDIVPDILKLCACLGVIVIHTASAGVTDMAVGSFGWLSSTFWSSLSRFCVPVFFMCSGSLLLDARRELTIRQLYSKYFLRVVIVALFWALMYGLFLIAGEYALYGVYEKGAIWYCLFNVLRFNHHLHLYYLQILLLFYAFVPIFRVLTTRATRREAGYAVAVWFVVGVGLPFFRQFYPLIWLTGITWHYNLNIVYCCLGYALLGWYMRTTKIERKHAPIFAATFIAGLAVTFGATVAASMSAGEVVQTYLEGSSLGPFLMSAGLFGLVQALADGKKAKPRLKKLVRASFCVYLIHHFFVMIFITVGFDVYFLPAAIAIPLETAAVFICSLAGYRLLSRIPVVRDYLI